MHHVWHRYKRPPTPSTAAPRADRAARTGCAKGCESCSAASSCRRWLEPTRAATYYLTLTRWTYYVTSPQVVGILAGGAVGLYGRPLVLPPETAPLGWLYLGVSKLGSRQ